MRNIILILSAVVFLFNNTLFTQVKKFKVFTTSNSEIPNDYISCLAINRYDNIWMAVDNGIASLDICTNGFVYDEIFINDSSYSSVLINCIAIDNFDKLWIGTNDGLVYNNYELYNSDTFSKCPITGSVKSIAIDSENNLWILEGLSWRGENLVKYDGTNWEVFDTLKSIVPNNYFTCITVDNEDNLWMGVWKDTFSDGKYLIKFDGTNWQTFELPDSVHGIASITIDDKGNKWIATGFGSWFGSYIGKGLLKLSSDNSTWTSYNRKNSDLTSNCVADVALDRLGNLWMTTNPEYYEEEGEWRGGGIVKFDGNKWNLYDSLNIDDEEWNLYDSLNIDWRRNNLTKILCDGKNNKWIAIENIITIGNTTYSYGYQLGVFNENGVVVNVAGDALLDNTPQKYILNQNYPNPFNPSTTIKYSIPKQSNVTLKVFDVLGSEVVALVNKEQSQGNYEVVFDGSDLTSGIYLYRIQAGDFVETKKMLLLK